MKITKLCLRCVLVAAYVAMMGGVTGCSHEKNELVHDHSHGHSHEHGHGEEEGHDHDEHEHHDADHDHHSHEGHDHGAGDEIVLEPERAAKFGVRVEHVHAGEFTDALRVSGRITGTATNSGSVSSPKAGIFTFANGITAGTRVASGQVIGMVRSTGVTGGDSNAAAKAALDAAKRELDRIKPLYEKQLVTAERYNQALSDYEIAKATYSPVAASGRVTAPVAGVITEFTVGQGEFVEAGTVVAHLADGSSLTLTADVPDRYLASVRNFDDARIVLNHTGETVDISTLHGCKVAGSGSVSATPGYIPVVFTFDNNGDFVPGQYVEVYLLGQPRQDVITVPLSAISEQQGNYFVYIRIDDEGYVKSPVTLGARDGRRVEITHGVHPHDDVVIEGVTAVRLAETSGVVPEGHTHSH